MASLVGSSHVMCLIRLVLLMRELSEDWIAMGE